MQENDLQISPFALTDRDAARQACKDFIQEYHPILSQVDNQLEKIMTQTEPLYAQAYKPWLKGLRDMCAGIFLMSKGIPLPDPAALVDALKMFCFDSTLKLLSDLCDSCKLAMKPEWIIQFRKDIDTMLFAAATLNRNQHALQL